MHIKEENPVINVINIVRSKLHIWVTLCSKHEERISKNLISANILRLARKVDHWHHTDEKENSRKSMALSYAMCIATIPNHKRRYQLVTKGKTIYKTKFDACLSSMTYTKVYSGVSYLPTLIIEASSCIVLAFHRALYQIPDTVAKTAQSSSHICISFS